MHIVKLKLSEKVHSRIEEIRALRSVATIEHFFLELADAEISQFRMLRIEKDFLLPQGNATPPPRIAVRRNRRRERVLSPATAQRILHLAQTEGLRAPALAKRFNVSIPTIHRVLQGFDEAEHVKESSHTVVRKKGMDIPTFSGVPKTEYRQDA